jgi:hypothetical protein
VKSTGENEESFPAFNDLFDEDAAQEEENESPAVEEKVEVKVILKEIGQNSEEWKDAMDKFPSAKMYQERLLDFVQFALNVLIPLGMKKRPVLWSRVEITSCPLSWICPLAECHLCSL